MVYMMQTKKNIKDGFSSPGNVLSGIPEMSYTYNADEFDLIYYVVTPNGNLRRYVPEQTNKNGDLLRSDMPIDERIEIHQKMQNTFLWRLLIKNYPNASHQDYVNAKYNNPNSLPDMLNELERYR